MHVFVTACWEICDLLGYFLIPNEDNTISDKQQIQKVNNTPKDHFPFGWYEQILDDLLEEKAICLFNVAQ